MDVMRPAAVGRHGNRPGLARDHLDPVGLDQGVDGEGAARLLLTVAAMAAMHEHGLRRQPIAHSAAAAPALEAACHGSPPILPWPSVLILFRRPAGRKGARRFRAPSIYYPGDIDRQFIPG